MFLNFVGKFTGNTFYFFSLLQMNKVVEKACPGNVATSRFAVQVQRHLGVWCPGSASQVPDNTFVGWHYLQGKWEMWERRKKSLESIFIWGYLNNSKKKIWLLTFRFSYVVINKSLMFWKTIFYFLIKLLNKMFGKWKRLGTTNPNIKVETNL